jgi:tetratricopeptide (TPR) repeat protein
LACAGIAALALANRSVVAAENGGSNLDGSSTSSSGGGGGTSAAGAMGGGEGGTNHNTISSSIIDGGNTTTTGSTTTTTTTATGKTLLETLLESSKASEKRDADQKEELRVLADTRFTKADNINQVNPMTWIGRGMLNLAQNRLDQARFFFENLTLRECGEILPALLGMAAVKYMEKDYAGALELYGRAISKYPKQSGSATRVGFGMACYRLGQIDRAKAAFRRAHELDSTNVEALVGIAVLEMSSLDPDVLDPREYRSKSENVIKMISMANLVDPTNAMVQNHLANHYFWKWTPVPGMVSVERGSNVVRGSMASSLEGGDRIRIGHEFETVVALDEEEDDGMMMLGSENMFRIKDAWKSDSACK